MPEIEINVWETERDEKCTYCSTRARYGIDPVPESALAHKKFYVCDEHLKRGQIRAEAMNSRHHHRAFNGTAIY